MQIFLDWNLGLTKLEFDTENQVLFINFICSSCSSSILSSSNSSSSSIHLVFRQHAASIYGFVCSFRFVSFVCFVKKNVCLNDQAHIAWFTSGVAQGSSEEEDDLWWKTTFDGRRPSTEDDLWQKTIFTEDDLWRRQPLTEDDLQYGYSILPEKNIFDSSPWQLQHNWP